MIEHGQAAAHVAHALSVERDANARVLLLTQPIRRGHPSNQGTAPERRGRPQKTGPFRSPCRPDAPSSPHLPPSARPAGRSAGRCGDPRAERVDEPTCGDPRRRRLSLEPRARARAEPVSGREDRQAPSAHEDGRGRAARPRRRPTRASRASRTRRPRASGRRRSSRPWPPPCARGSRTNGSTSRRGRTRCPPTCCARRARSRSPSSTRAPTSRTPTSRPSRRRPGTSSTTERAVADKDGHGTFVSALAAGSVTNAEGIAGFGGDAQLLMVKAVGASDSFSDVDEAAAIVYAVDHGAKIINLSLGGVGASELEERAIEYAAEHDVLLVAAAGQRVRLRQPDRVSGRGAATAGLERPGRRRALGRRQHDGRHARELLEHGLPHLARGTRRERLRRDRGRVVAHVVAALQASRLPCGPVRMVERHILRDARGRRRRRARVGREPGADRRSRSPRSSSRPRPAEPGGTPGSASV